MNQTLLDRAVARATGESIDIIRRLGFTPLHPTRAAAQPVLTSGREERPRAGEAARARTA